MPNRQPQQQNASGNRGDSHEQNAASGKSSKTQDMDDLNKKNEDTRWGKGSSDEDQSTRHR